RALPGRGTGACGFDDRAGLTGRQPMAARELTVAGPTIAEPRRAGYEGAESAAMHILFVTATRIGDAVLSTGLLSHLIERHPQARLTIAAGPVAAPLFEAVPGLERLIVVNKERWRLHWPRLYAAVAARRWELVVDLRGSALAWLLRAG